METLMLTRPFPHVVQVTLSRPSKLNSMNLAFFVELKKVFEDLQTDEDSRVVVLAAEGKAFTAGLDLQFASESLMGASGNDSARKELRSQPFIQSLQDAFSAIERLDKPVIAVVQGSCVGGGVDLASACDIRYATADARISVREIDLSIVADLGTLQRMPKIVGSDSWVRELVYTARWADSEECQRNGFFSRILPTHEIALSEALATASIIASKSPLAVLGCKRTLRYSRDHSVSEGLEYVRSLSSSIIQSPDIELAVTAILSKQKPVFPKL